LIAGLAAISGKRFFVVIVLFSFINSVVVAAQTGDYGGLDVD
jgi:hypothetical protein